ncbi:MAG: hypothetical protein ABMA26_17390, partial [Limisphaerales bacterium]
MEVALQFAALILGDASAEDRALRGRNLSAAASLTNGRPGHHQGGGPASLPGQCQSAKSTLPHYFWPHEKLQLIHRLPAPFIRHLLAQFRADQLSAAAAQAELQLSKTRFYQLYSAYLAAAAHGLADSWTPGNSGGDHHAHWPPAVINQLTTLLASQPPSSYSACASELLRRLDFKTDRASVRRWAIANKRAPDTRYKRPPQPVKRWQVRDLGALWQYDATPHAFLPGSTVKQCLLDLLDDATRCNTGARLYESESLLAHLDFLARAFQVHGLPLALYVDFHSFFYTHTPDAFTQLGAALHFYGVALRFAPTPQAKGKIERRHDYWQKRLPPLLAADHILELECANRLLDQLLPHANQHEIHREL